MDAIHDLGAMNGFGSVGIASDEPAFHLHWQAIFFAPNIFGITVLREYTVGEYRRGRG